jgi:hypothetical protein
MVGIRRVRRWALIGLLGMALIVLLGGVGLYRLEKDYQKFQPRVVALQNSP